MEVIKFGHDGQFEIKAGQTPIKVTPLKIWAKKRGLHFQAAQKEAFNRGQLINPQIGVAQTGNFFVTDQPYMQHILDAATLALEGTFLVKVQGDINWRLAMAFSTFMAVTGAPAKMAKGYLADSSIYGEALLDDGSQRPFRIVVAKPGIYHWSFSGPYNRDAAIDRLEKVYKWPM